MMTDKENRTKRPTYDIFAYENDKKVKVGVAWVPNDKMGLNCSIDIRNYKDVYFIKRLKKKIS
jgi:hypothetical protein